jgi:transketolase
MLTDAALADDRILLLTGDHGYALFDEFRRECPDQYINCGIAEQNMIGVAAGLIKMGFKPVVYGLSAFVPMRVLEQIKMDICYEELPIILIGDGAGIVYGQLGPSHQCTEDVAALRAIPNIDIYSPADVAELDYCFTEMLKFKRPSYFRFGKADLGDVHATLPNSAYGDLLAVRDGGASRAFIATGSMVSTACAIADNQNEFDVFSVPVISPMNVSQVKKIADKYDVLYVMEEHSRNGGLGSLISEIVAENPVCRVVRFGINNKFSGVCGDYKYLMEYHGLDRNSIEKAISE